MSNRAMKSNQANPLWAGQAMRLDPFHLPMQFGFNSDMGEASVSVTETGVVMRRVLPSGLPMSIALPLRAFEGVAARVHDGEDGMTVSLELLHKDEEMCVPLLVSEGLEQAANDWHAWCETTGLPMIMIDMYGVAKPVDNLLGELPTSEPQPRRRSMTLRRRRPRIFMKRKTGQQMPRMRIHGREIVSEGV